MLWYGTRGIWKGLSWTDIDVRVSVCTVFSLSILDDFEKLPPADTFVPAVSKGNDFIDQV